MAGASNSISRRARMNGGWKASSLAVFGLIATLAAAPARAEKGDNVYAVGNYPVQATAANAVAAKEQAIADGQQAAFRSLLKRLVPVTAYRSLAKLKGVNTSNLIDSVAIRSERNSSTEYIASYDFVFSPDPVRRLLDAQGIPYLDRQAPAITIVTAYRIPAELKGKLPQTFSDAAGSDTWLYAWKALDLANSLTPAVLKTMKREVHDDTIQKLAGGDLSYLRAVENEYRTPTVLVAILEPETDLKKIKVVLCGRDAVQTLYLKRSYKLDGYDLAYTAEFAAVISLAILEGRWKAINVRTSSSKMPAEARAPAAQPGFGAQPASSPWGSVAAGAGQAGSMTISVQFRGMTEWQSISRELSQTPEVTRFEVLGLSPRGARVALTYPGGAEQLAGALAQRGLSLQGGQQGWTLVRR
ncbi:MAG: DUF2066 domain-containing protein [Hyphomicrobiaceae bacterium]